MFKNIDLHNFQSLMHRVLGRHNHSTGMSEQVGSSDKTQSIFVDLAPTDDADKAGVYSEAIQIAIDNSKVTNIALTGPYGSGKSSIIRSFLNNSQSKVLHISLATFGQKDNADGDADGNADAKKVARKVTQKVTRQEIERSILQQMLYSIDAKKLPLSRFKRIQSPGVRLCFTPLFIMFGIISLWYVFHNQTDIISRDFFRSFELIKWQNLFLAIAIIFLWATCRYLYIASFGVSLKSVSLRDIEIRPAADSRESILNRHLDEIIYFFQSTDYDLVVIEDLDRFNDPEIFTTLREINSLVNKSAGVNRTIKFLYALRDDMFINTDRTKFFEFIIPVIPIINSSNSIDMVKMHVKRLELGKRLDSRFLKDVSRYLDDLRLIQNIFNEYSIYASIVEREVKNFLDPNKLLAILIYKNYYPKDFEKLHRRDGNLAGILKRKNDLIEYSEIAYRDKIGEIQKGISAAEFETQSVLKELRQKYTDALIEILPNGVISISIDGNNQIPLDNVIEHEALMQLIEMQHVWYSTENNINIDHDISDLQNNVDDKKTYIQRKEEIENTGNKIKNKYLFEIDDTRADIAKLRTIKLHELIKLNPNRIDELFAYFDKNEGLARFLVLEGYIDDTYNQYTSYFHKGRLSLNDNKFLIQIRAYVTPDPMFPIDNPNEVIDEMRYDDFQQSYALNVKLIDCLLEDRSRHQERLYILFEFIASEFEKCEEFFDAYYASGEQITQLVSGLSDEWDDFVPTAIASPMNISHIVQLITSLDESSLKSLAKDNDKLPEFVSTNLPEILAHSPELSPERLQFLQAEVRDLAAINEHSSVVRFMFENGCFELNIENLEYAYEAILGESNLKPLRERNFTTILSMKNPHLIDRVERNFDRYFHDVLLELPDNSKEDASAILNVIQRETLDQDGLRKFLERQSTQFSSLDDVPAKLHAMLFESGSIEPTWGNCLDFMAREEFKAESLVEYLDREDIRSSILQHTIPNDPDSTKLRLFLFNANSLSDAAYKEYARSLPKPIKSLPKNIDQSKRQILIEVNKLSFSSETFEALADNRDLQILFVSNNIDQYFADQSSFALDDDFREGLLQKEIDQGAKRKIVKLMDLGSLINLPERSALIGPIIDNSNINMFNLDSQNSQSLIKNSEPIATQISLFNKLHACMTDDEVRAVLKSLPHPYCDIIGYNTLQLENLPENVDLLRWLKSRKIISSWRKGASPSGKIRVYLRRE